MQQIQLVITGVVENGQVTGVRVGGPVNDKFLCYGLLGLASDAVRAFKAPESPTVEIPDAAATRVLLGA